MKIFLSYSTTDRDLADRIRLALLAEHHTVFFDRDDLAPGLAYDARIAEAIDQADVFLFLISPESVMEGRYTLTELGLAKRKWSHPNRHVLPVMIRATPFDRIPPYLKAVTVLKPAGDVPAEVAEEIRRMAPSWLRRSRIFIGAFALAVIAGLLFVLSGFGSQARQAVGLLQAAQTLEGAGEYSAAWAKIQEARAHLDESPLTSLLHRSLVADVQSRRADIAVAWLDHMRLREGERFSDVVSQLLPSLDEAVAETEGERKADLLAHRGWADFLRSRDSGQQFTPDSYYRQALDIDPANVYAHAMWGHWILWRQGRLNDAREHFNAALASGRERPYVRNMQLIALHNGRRDETNAELLRIVHDMMMHSEPITEQTRSDVGSLYFFACGRQSPGKMENLLRSLPAKDHVDLLRRLFFKTDQSDTRTIPQRLCLARLEEEAGLREDALKTYRALQERLTPRDEIWPLTQSAVARLSGVKQ
jgi:tetratricopeptide (TPR) repeat protein